MPAVSALEGHRLWAGLYDQWPNPLLALEGRWMAPLLGPLAGTRIADVGCGTGRWLARLAAEGADVVGLDPCHEMLARAARKQQAGKLLLARAEALPVVSGWADLTICAFAAAYWPGLPAGFAEMARITRRGGRVVLSDLHPMGMAAGWTRSFRAGGVAYELEHRTWSLEPLRDAAASAGLRLESEIHAHFGEPERPIFAAAGKPMPEDTPAVWIGVWGRP